MLKNNKSHFCIHCIARKQKRKKLFSTKKVFDIVVAKKSKHNKYFVIQKIGSIDFHFNKICINFFRLVYWLQCNPAISCKAWKYLEKYIFSKNW